LKKYWKKDIQKDTGKKDIEKLICSMETKHWQES